jgi:phage-related minor tail protein
MAEKIRGITIELGGDASGLDKALKDVNGKIKNTQEQLKDVERLLKLDPKNTELLAQKQKLLGDQINNTKSKLDTLKKTQDTMDQNGVDKNSDQYMALQREIINTERELGNLENASKKTSEAMSGISQAADNVSQGAQKVADKTKELSGAAAAALAAIGALAYKTVQSADDLNTLAKQTGFSTDELQKFQYASDLVDVSMDDITGAAKKLKKAVSSDSKALASLGVKTRKADGSFRDINDIFYGTLAALGNIDNETERDAKAMEIFGKSADSLAGIVDDGGKALKELGQEAEDLGLIMSQDTLDSLNKVNDEIDTLKAQAKARLAETGAKAMEALTPVLEKVIGLIGQLLTFIGGLNTEQIETIIGVLAVIAAISPLASLISTISGMVAAIPTLINGVSTALTWLMANPMALVIAAIVALVVLIATKGDEIQAMLQRFDDWLQSIFAKDWTEVFGPVLGGILNGFFDKIKDVWDSIKQIFDGIIDFIRGVFTGDWQRAWEGVKKIFSGIMDGLALVFKWPLNAIISMINKIIDGINWLIGQANKLAGVFGVQIGKIGYIPMLANGGIVTKGQAIVGEAGPELLNVSNGKTTVTPLTNNAASTDPTTIVVQSILDGRIIGETVTKYQGRMARANG